MKKIDCQFVQFLLILLFIVMFLYIGKVYGAQATVSLEELKGNSPKNSSSVNKDVSKKEIKKNNPSDSLLEKEGANPTNLLTEDSTFSTPKKSSRPVDWKLNPQRGKPTFNIGLTVFSLIVVCIIAYGGLKVYSVYFSGNNKDSIFGRKLVRVRERHMLGPNKMLCVVEIPDKVVLLGVTENDIKIITDISMDSLDKESVDDDNRLKESSSASSYLTDVLLKKWQQGNK